MSGVISDPSALRTLLIKHGVTEAVVLWLVSAGCRDIPTFANWVDDKAELKQEAIDKTASKDDRAQLASLKMAWREAEALTARGVKRTAEGMPTVDPDTPLDPDLQQQLETCFRKTYDWPRILARQMGSDSLLGRVRREFEKRQPSMLAVMRVRSLARSQRGHAPKTSRLSEHVHLTLGPDYADEGEPGVANLYTFLTNLQVLANTWAVAGCFEADVGPAGATTKARFAHWADTSEYQLRVAEEAHQRLVAHSEASVLHYVTVVEEELRVRAIELVRGTSQAAWGEALLRVVSESSHLWQDRKELLLPRRSFNPPPAGAPVPPKAPGTQKPPAIQPPPGRFDAKVPPKAPPAGQAPGRKRWATSKTTSGNWVICKKFNDGRGCSNRACPDGYAHVCDVILASSQRPCQAKDHNRAAHDPHRHGMPHTIR